MNETTVQARHDTGTCFSVVKCTEIVFEHKMVKGEELKLLDERMRTMDTDDNQIYNFLGVEPADGRKIYNFFERLKDEVVERTKLLVNTEIW